MTDLFLKIVNMSISATYLVLAVVVLRLVLKKAPKWVNVLLWGLVAVRLVCPFTLESALSLIPSAETVSPEIMTDPSPTIHTGIEAVNSVVNPVITETFTPDPAASANPLQILIPVLSVVWIIGMALMLLYTFVSYWRLRHKVRMAIRVKDDIYLSEYVSSPFVLGIFKPRIYLPYHMDELDRFHVIAHERTHIRRRDHWWKPLGFGLLTIHWFNPAMWVAYILLCRDIELACDERVIQNMKPQQRANYSQALLNCSVDRRSIAACPIAFGEVGVKERVKNVLHYKKPAFWAIVIAVIICAVVAVCFLTDPVDQETSDSSVSFADFDFSKVTKIKLTNGHNGNITWLFDTAQIDSVCTFLRTVSGSSGTTSKGIYEGSYSLILITDSDEEIHIIFGDTNHLFYGDYGDGYPTMYNLENINITDVTDFLCQFDGNAAAISDLGIQLSIQDVTPAGARMIFSFDEAPPEGRYFDEQGYTLQTFLDGAWTDVELLPGVTVPDWFSMPADMSHLFSQAIDWSWYYGELPAGTYRIGKTIHDTLTEEIQTLYVQFTQEEDGFPIAMTAQDISATGVTLRFHSRGNISPGTYSYSSTYTLQLFDGAQWVDVEMLSQGKDIAWAEENYDCVGAPLVTVSWEQLCGELPPGNYCIGKNISNNSKNGESRMLYAKFTIHSEDSSGNTPYSITSTLSADGLSGHADYLIAGGGYNFFDYMDEEIVEILNALTEEDFVLSRGITPDTTITLSKGDLKIILNSDGEYVEFSFDTDTASQVASGIWAVKNDALNDFFTMMNSYSPENSTYEIYNVAPLEDLPRSYNLEEATMDKCVIMIDGDVTDNQDVWEAFIGTAYSGAAADVRIVQYFSAGEKESSQMVIYDLTCDGTSFTLRWFEDGTEYLRTYAYLQHFFGEPESASVTYDAYDRYVLTNEAGSTWEELWQSLTSSQSGAAIDFFTVYSDLIFYPDHPTIPDLTAATLQQGGESLLTITEEATLQALRDLFASAEGLGYEPKTYSLVPTLVLTGADGSTVIVELDILNDLCRIGGVFYDYGPGYDDWGSIHATEQLLALLGLTDWPA